MTQQVKQRKSKERKGFSLIEVNMAIFVLAGGALALLALFPYGLNFSRNANAAMRVTTAAQQFVSAVRIAAEDPEVLSAVDSEGKANPEAMWGKLESKVEDITGLILSDIHDENAIRAFDLSGGGDNKLWYKAWIVESPNMTDVTPQDSICLQAGIQLMMGKNKPNNKMMSKEPVTLVDVYLN